MNCCHRLTAASALSTVLHLAFGGAEVDGDGRLWPPTPPPVSVGGAAGAPGCGVAVPGAPGTVFSTEATSSFESLWV
jgi:hypothetical protein